MLCCVRAPPDDVTEVDVSSAGLRHLPDEVWLSGRTLESLRADGNRVRELPRALFTCTHLRLLALNDNEIGELPPAVRALAHLEHLDLSRNAIADLPAELRALRRLRVLHLSGNPLERPPDALATLVFLRELFLNDARLEFLPANFGRLTELRILEVRDNRLVLLPKSLARCADLRRLDVGQNEFSDFPEVIGKLTALRELWLDCNDLEAVPPLVGNLPELVHLEAGDNRISELAPEIGACVKLTDLNLTSNRLGELPDAIGNLANLVSLKLDRNRLLELPDGIGGLVGLEELTLSSNFLRELPSTIGRLRKLRHLVVDENLLGALPPEIGGCGSLTVLSLRSNRLSSIPREIGRLSELKVLNLVGNSLGSLPRSLLNCSELVALWLSENQSKPLVPMQSEIDLAENVPALTCFLLPQTSLPEGGRPPGDGSFASDVPISARHISFVDVKSAAKAGAERPGQLRRAPTPYPKELRALAKHAKGARRDSVDEPAPPMRNAIRVEAARVTPTLRQKFANNRTISNPAGDRRERSAGTNLAGNGFAHEGSPPENPHDGPANREYRPAYRSVDRPLYSGSADRENYSTIEERVNDIIERSSQDLYAATRVSGSAIPPLENLSIGAGNGEPFDEYTVTARIVLPPRESTDSHRRYAYDHYSRYPAGEYSTRSEEGHPAMPSGANDRLLNNVPTSVFDAHQHAVYYNHQNHQNGNGDNLYDSTSGSSHHGSYVQNGNPTPGYAMYDPVMNANNIRTDELRPPSLRSSASVSPSKMNPPPYHIAATYSKQAQFFNSNN